MNENVQRVEDEDPYAKVPPPASTDGPQEPVDPTELEEEGHAVLPEGEEDEDGEDS